jgi:hypothetical protein
MGIEQFNEKWSQYLEPRFYGMSIDNSAVCEYLDQVFEELSKVPNFQYSQIKMKNGSARFYCEPWFIDTHQIEFKINQIINESSGNRESNI